MTTKKGEKILRKPQNKILPDAIPSEDKAPNSNDNTNASDNQTKDAKPKIWYRKTWKESDATDKAMVITTIAIALFTGFLLLISYFQSREYVKAVHVENRAYILPETPIIKPLEDGTPAVIIPFVNFGKTPAYGFHQEFKFQKWDTIAEDPRTYDEPAPFGEKTLAPQYPDTEVVQRDASHWKENGKGLFVYGKFWYTDFLGKHHFGAVAYYWEFARGKTFAVYPGYDTSDDHP